MLESETRNENKGREKENESMLSKGNGMQKTVTVRHESKIYGNGAALPILVSEQQFEIVKAEQLASMNLLNDSAVALLDAMKSCVPPEGSTRVIGEYTGQNMRQLAKSICDVIRIKTQVIRSIHSVARDEF